MKGLSYCCLMLVLSVFTGLCAAGNPQVTLCISGPVSGSIVIELYPKEAPVTVANFVDYVQNGFYDGLIFHRVIRNFMIQGGGFCQDLIKQETGPMIPNESSNGLSNVRGTIAMARTPYPHSATCEFFINHVNNASLDYVPVLYDAYNNAYSKFGYCVFGQVVEGMDIVDAIASQTTTTKNAMNDVPIIDVIIQSATVTLNEPVCADKLEGDINGDCRVDFADFVKLAENWLLCNAINTVCN